MDINRCFRTLGVTGHVALKYHPDKTRHNSSLLERFIEARNAYDNIVKFKKAVK